ncbi:lantibiotic dehydratase [Streptomyces sp. NPDC006314]|uniref:lantibiotic dehydratase n=1 Tax=Streptomyces sp. NPDC006314 TaxID=3154475 RepID=UPI0033AA61FE
MNGKMFTAQDPVLVRLAAVSQNRLHATLPGLDPRDDAYRSKLTDLLQAMSSDALFREAVHVSSPRLGRVLEEAFAGRQMDARKAERSALSALRYFLRMSHRPTPFGIMAGVALGHVGQHTRARIGISHRKHVRADAGWIADVMTQALDDRPTRNRLVVVWNNLCTVRGDRLVVPYTTRTGSQAGSRRSKEISIRYTSAVATVMDAARQRIGYRQLIEVLCAEHPQASEDTADEMLHSLLKSEVLLTEFHTGHTSDDLLGRLIDLLAGAQAPYARELREVAEALERYSRSAPAAGSDAREQAIRSMRTVHADMVNPLQVDMKFDAEVVIGRTVADEAEKAATALWRMSPRSRYAHLRDYFTAFMEHYGPDTAVPILELLDPHAGIGAPETYAWPATGPASDQGDAPLTAIGRTRRSVLADLLQDCLVNGHRVLELDDELVDRLSYPADEDASQSLDLCVQVLASSIADVDEGKFRLVLSPVAGSAQAGSVMGRFADMLDGTAALRRLLVDEATSDDTIVADLYFQPVEARLRNVTRVPRITRRSIPVGTFPRDDDGTALDLADLAVEVHRERLRLVWGPNRTPVTVVVPHMLNLPMAAPNAARLIAELSADSAQPWRNWNWGVLESFPYLPRVMYGRTILHPARWLPSDAMRDGKRSWCDWLDELRTWQARRNVPHRVRVVVSDRYLDLDLRELLHCKLLRSELTKHLDAQVFESCVAEGDFDWIGGHANELVIPLKRNGNAFAAPNTRIRRTAEAAPVLLRHGTSTVQPGGEWLYLKVYAVAGTHDRILAVDLPRLLASCQAKVDRWFYIRYADPEPHLRIRLHGKPNTIRAQVTAAVHEWSSDLVARRLARSTSMEAYRPELARYGGAALMTTAEKFFHADSEIVVSQLQTRTAGRLPVDDETLAAANFLGLLQAFGNWDWNRWIVGAYPKASTPRSKLPAPEHLALLDPSGAWTDLSASAAGASVVASWAHWEPSAVAYARSLIPSDGPTPLGTRVLKSLLHMNFNRLFGINREAEVRACGIMRNAAWSHLERSR